METALLLMNAVFLTFIVSTMFNVGLVTTVGELADVLRNGAWMAGALTAGLVLVPLIGWGIAELFALSGAAFVALLLVASSPGAPFAVSLTQMQGGNVVAGASTMAILAVIGSFTTPITVDLLVGAADVAAAGGGDIDVLALVRSIVLLQIVPFVVGMAMHAWVPETAAEWQPLVKKVSSISFGLVMLAILIGGIQQVLDLVGSRLLIAALVATLLWFVAGALLSPGGMEYRGTAAMLAGSRNAGPVLLIAAASFSDVQGVVPALIAIFIVGLAAQVVVSSYIGKRRIASSV